MNYVSMVDLNLNGSHKGWKSSVGALEGVGRRSMRKKLNLVIWLNTDNKASTIRHEKVH